MEFPWFRKLSGWKFQKVAQNEKNKKGNAEVVAAIREGFAQNKEIYRANLVYMSRNLTEIKKVNKKKMGKLDKVNKKIGSDKNSGSSYILNSNNKNIWY